MKSAGHVARMEEHIRLWSDNLSGRYHFGVGGIKSFSNGGEGVDMTVLYCLRLGMGVKLF